ncbi:hypothetical protein EI94DRAFT_1801883 [Lactarius quietus]|nr:hypothetical protein EI94DRAFT_1801883 [Lactarius quietus]
MPLPISIKESLDALFLNVSQALLELDREWIVQEEFISPPPVPPYKTLLPAGGFMPSNPPSTPRLLRWHRKSGSSGLSSQAPRPPV